MLRRAAKAAAKAAGSVARTNGMQHQQTRLLNVHEYQVTAPHPCALGPPHALMDPPTAAHGSPCRLGPRQPA